MAVGLQQIPVEESRRRIDDALDEMPVINMGFTEVHRRAEALLGNIRRAIRAVLTAEVEVAVEG